MEKFDSQEYRDELAHDLKDIRNSDSENVEKAHAKAEGYLEAKKETEDYEKAKDIHMSEVSDQINWKKVRGELLSIAEHKEKMQELFELVDEIIEKGIYFREHQLSLVYAEDYKGFYDMRPFGETSPDSTRLPSEYASEFKIDAIQKEVVSLRKKYINLLREGATKMKRISLRNKEVKNSLPGLSSLDLSSYIPSSNIYFDIFSTESTVGKHHYEAGFNLGIRKIVHTDENLSWEYRNSKERINRFKAFVKSFKITQKEKE